MNYHSELMWLWMTVRQWKRNRLRNVIQPQAGRSMVGHAIGGAAAVTFRDVNDFRWPIRCSYPSRTLDMCLEIER